MTHLPASLIALCASASLALAANEPVVPQTAPASAGQALLSTKVVTCANEGAPVVNRGVILVRDGVIEAVGRQGQVEIPDGYEVVDVGDDWLIPGLVEMHCHVGGTFDINDGVYLTNPGMSARVAVIPNNPTLHRGMAAGVTTVLFIPGSATNIGGMGVLFKTGMETWDEALIRDPGSLKLAQAGNPERFGWGIGRAFMNWNTRDTFERGIEYAQAWEAFEAGQGPEPLVDPQFEILRALRKDEARISTHTQMYQVSLMTVTMVAQELGLPVFIDHGTFDSYHMGGIAYENDVIAIIGPRSIDPPSRGMMNWAGTRSERVQGCAAGYQENGHQLVGFNTDSPVIAQEELQLQAAMAVRYGFDDSDMQAIRGLTIVPAMAAGIDGRVGSLEVGKDADILQITGHPADPRAWVKRVWVNGQSVYDTTEETRRW